MSSLADQLRKRAQALRATETVVTRTDGTRFVESRLPTPPPDHSTTTTTHSPPLSMPPPRLLHRVLAPQAYGFVVDTRPDSVPARLTERLFVGAQDCADPAVLAHYRITHVLSLGIPSPPHTQRLPSVQYHFAACLDLPETDLWAVVRAVRAFLDAAGRALVHCNAGVSRAPSVCIGYLMLVGTCGDYQAAYDLVKAARPCIQPNAGFARQLARVSHM